MQRSLSRLLIIFLSATTLPATAQSMKPGLWEVTNKITSANSQLARQMSEMHKQIAAMPPEKRKAMEQAMAKNAGVNLPTMTDDGMRVKICMSKEMVTQNQLPVQQQGNCKHERMPLVDNSMKMSFVCTNPDSRGDGIVEFQSDSAYTMKMNMTAGVGGKAEVTSMQARGKWLAADCGAIRPLGLPPPAPAPKPK